MKKLSTLLWEIGSKILPDEVVLKILFRKVLGQKLNLDNPQTFNEKLQWLKLYYREPLFTAMVDKYGVKQYIANLIGEQYIAKTYGIYDSFDEIDFSSLPNSFVMKCTHNSGSLVIVKDKNKLDHNAAKRKLQGGLKHNYFYFGREWPYKNIQPRILVEEFLHDDKNEVLPVYKFFNFNNGATIIQAITNDKMSNESIDYFDENWNLLPIQQVFPNSETPPTRPDNLEEMLQLSVKLSRGFPFLRTDFYNVGGRTYFSEFTFYSDSGFGKFCPDSWDKELGNRIQLPKLHIRRKTMNAKLNHLVACIKHPLRAAKYISERRGGVSHG
ncbi:MAG: hypothetical protein IJ859_06065 [Synergistaceae bacterium]|nr:hypothetical protein [Synergistaceae bacterium]